MVKAATNILLTNAGMKFHKEFKEQNQDLK